MNITLRLTITRNKKPKPETRQHEPQPECNNFAHIEPSGQVSIGHLDADERPGNYGRPISMKWQPPQR